MSEYSGYGEGQYEQEPDWLKKIRADARAYEALTKKANGRKPEELVEGYFNLERQQRVSSLADTLKAKGVNPKAAQFFPADLDPTAENVEAWLKDFGDVFGAPTPPQEGNPQEGQSEQSQPPTGSENTERPAQPEWASQFRQVQGTDSAGEAPTRQTTTEAQLLELASKSGDVREFIASLQTNFQAHG